MKLYNVFPIPVVSFKFSKHYKYSFPEIEKLDRRPKTWTTPLNTSYPNVNDDDPFLPLDVRDSLKNDLNEDLSVVFSNLDIPSRFKFDEFWYNVYHDNQGQEPHTHLNGCVNPIPYWCGIYYNKNATPTKFYRPDLLNRIHQFPVGKNAQPFIQYFSDTVEPPVEEGDVILFPPYLKHSVSTGSDAKMRLTFSFNLGFYNE
jgi:hypothetical protein